MRDSNDGTTDVSADTEIVTQRREAARILRRNRDKIIRRWMNKVRLLTREKGVDHLIKEQALRDEAREIIGRLLVRLEGRSAEGDMAAFYHLILAGRQYHIRPADIAYVLLELKSVSKQVIFEDVEDELEAFRVSRVVDDNIEAVLRKSTELYQLTSEADQKTAQERLQEVFAAWDLEEALSGAQSPAMVCHVVAGKLGALWEVTSVLIRIYDPLGKQPRDLSEGGELPSPMGGGAGGRTELIEWVREQRKAVVCVDVRSDESLLNAPELIRAGVRSLACCPLVAREQTVGVMLLYAAGAGTFQNADIRRLRDFAGVLALAFDRVGRVERSQKEISEAEVITRIGRALLELPDREELLQGVAEALRAFRDYFDVSLFHVDREMGECRLVAEAGRGRRFRPEDYTQEVGTGFIGICALRGETIRSSELETDSRRHIAFEEEHRARSELAVPITRGENVLGVMHVLSDREDDFAESEISAFEHVAPHIGVALQNARMITQRRHERYELEQAHRQLVNIIRSTAIGITSTDTAGVYTHWSRSCEALLGYSAEEVVGSRTPLDFAEEPYDLQQALQQCLADGQMTAERTMVRKDGRPRIVRETRVPLEDEEGRHVGFTAYLVDVTEQKRAEEDLKRERDTLNLVVEAMGAGLGLYDRRQRLQWANTTLMEWFDFGPEMFGRECSEIYSCGVAEVADCPMRTAASTGEPQVRVMERTDEFGLWRCYQQVCTPVRFGEAQFVVMTFDITDQRRQTEQMRLINKLTERVETSLDLDRVLHLVLTCVTAGHAIGFNRAFIFLISDDRQRLEGRMAVGPVSAEDAVRIWRGLAEEDQPIEEMLETIVLSESDAALTERLRELQMPLGNVDDALVRTLQGRPVARTWHAGSSAGVWREFVDRLEMDEFVAVPLAAQDEPLGVMVADNKYSGKAINRDQMALLEMFSRQASMAIGNARAYAKIEDQLGELERTRDRLIEAERMASVGRMASHLAHEIRNPLTAIGGFAASIARQAEEGSSTHRSARIIFEEVRRLERSLVNVLDYTRPLRPTKRPVQVNDVVRETAEQFRSQLDEAGISLKLSLDEHLPVVMADAGMIKQVVINLLKNAMEALEGHESPEVLIATASADDMVRIVLEDNGGGMDETALDELFSPFYSTKIGGIGLGLSVTRRIVRQHSGRIEARSTVGVGSRFTVTLALGDAR